MSVIVKCACPARTNRCDDDTTGVLGVYGEEDTLEDVAGAGDPLSLSYSKYIIIDIILSLDNGTFVCINYHHAGHSWLQG